MATQLNSTQTASRRRWIVVLVVALIVAVGIAIAVIVIQRDRRSVAARPYIVGLAGAPTTAQPLIRSIAQRVDAGCYSAILGKRMSPTVVVGKYNFQNYDYVRVVDVRANATVVSLEILCGGGGGQDDLQLTPAGWKELGIRQM